MQSYSTTPCVTGSCLRSYTYWKAIFEPSSLLSAKRTQSAWRSTGIRPHSLAYPRLQKSRSSVSVGVTASAPARHVPQYPAPSGSRAGNAQPIADDLSTGKKKGQATTSAILVARAVDCVQFFCHDRTKPFADARKFSGTKPK